jgi:hypothetical protein
MASLTILSFRAEAPFSLAERVGARSAGPLVVQRSPRKPRFRNSPTMCRGAGVRCTPRVERQVARAVATTVVVKRERAVGTIR